MSNIQHRISNNPESHPIPDELQRTWDSHVKARKDCRTWAEGQGFSLSCTRSYLKGNDRFVRLVCPHYGEPRNNEEKTVVKPQQRSKIYHADDNGNVERADEKEGQKQKQTRTGYTQRIGCTYQIRLKPVTPTSMEWIVGSITGEHNHPIAQHPSKYPLNRRLTGDILETVISMIKAQAENKTVMQFLEGRGITVKSHDITNLRMSIYQNDPGNEVLHLITQLQNNGYEVRYSHAAEGKKIFLKGLFFAHEDAIKMAREIPDVISIDATYRTTREQLAFINVVGTCNVGHPALKTFCIAGGWMTQETNESYEWFIGALKEVVWPSDGPSTPRVLISDSEAALIRAMDIHFPDAKKLLCTVHMRRNFEVR